MRSKILVTVGVVLVASLTEMSAAAAAEGTIEADGEAMVQRGDVVAAKKAAVADALKNAIDKVVGVTVESEFNSVLKETVKNNQSDFQAAVADRVTKKSEGFIKTYDVLSENNDGKVFKVRVRATVFESKVKAEIEELAQLIKDAGNPRLMIVIQDVIYTPEGKELVQAESMLGTHIEKALIERGIEVRGKRAAKEVTANENKFDQWSKRTDSVAEMARKEGADLLVFGRVEIRDKGAIENAAFAALNGQRRVEISATIRGVVANSGELVSVQPVSMSEMGINLEKAVSRALTGRGKNLVNRTFDPLFVDLKTAFRKAASAGSTFQVVLSNVRNYRQQGRKFVGIIEAFASASNVQHKFNDGVLQVNLSCKCSTDELQDHIFKAIETEKAFQNLDVSGVAGRQISLKL